MYARDTALIATPIGTILLAGDDEHLYSVSVDTGPMSKGMGQSVAVRLATAQLEQWFAGERLIFDVPLAPAATARGRVLRQAMGCIGYGKTSSYGALARSIGSSARAIGQACARNPFPIIVPCHRVLNADQSLGAYSAGAGPSTKQWLLDFEQGSQTIRLL